jgi:general secretion pathway protein G
MNPAGNWPGAPQMQRRRPAGFSMLELALVVVVVSVLATVALGRFLYYQERAEKVAMESTLAIVKMGLQMRLAELIVTNRQAFAVQLERENPMKWLDPIPDNYAGEYVAPIKSGNWYYAAAEHELVYLPSGTSYLDLGQSALAELRYHVVLQFDRNAVTGHPAPIGVGLVPSRDFKWF